MTQCLREMDRPTAVFPYDWRRSLSELSKDFHEFCQETYPGQPVQVVAHSMGGLLAFEAMRAHPDKYKPGAVLVGVPFGSGIAYLEDMNVGYYTELKRCRQFTPIDQFTFSSHWCFFPREDEVSNDFVDVSPDAPLFEANISSIGRTLSECSPAMKGKHIKIDFFDARDWERLQLGVFDPVLGLSEDVLQQYRAHLEIVLEDARRWKECLEESVEEMPPLVVCASNAVPTSTQILRRSKEPDPELKSDHQQKVSLWEYDYVSGRKAPGDGRIDYANAFPKADVLFKEVPLDSTHVKQMILEEKGGNLGKVWKEVLEQIESFKKGRN